ncbi:MAG: hypothetical protein CVU87_04020 [Firmicutes bacterium HGW-Firmicutes-12]|nr:MAG: hypothetical protein CVU87_04020 [Firmicutes bacterium HGW-Firmicutes-12]
MKKTFSIILGCCLIVGVVFLGTGCGSKNNNENEEAVTQDRAISIDSSITESIDAVFDKLNSGAIGEEEAVESIKEIIPKPADHPDYPKSNVNWVIGWGEGGGSDLYARNIGREAEKFLGKSFVYNNMPGAGSEVGYSFVLGQPADGYTIFGTVNPNMCNDAFGDVPYSFAEETQFIISNQGSSEALWVLADSPFKTIDDLVKYAKENPGDVVYSGSAAKSETELSFYLMENHYDIDMTYLGFEKAGERVSSLLGGHAQVLYESVGPVADLIRAGEVRPIVYLGANVYDGIDPDVPSSEQIGLPSVPRYRGVVAKNGLPVDITEYLYYVFYAGAQMPVYKQYEERANLHYSQPWSLDPLEFKAYYLENKKKLGEIIEKNY